MPFRDPRENQRLEAIVSAHQQINLASAEIRRLRTITNHHKLSPGAKISLQAIRAHLDAALSEVESALEDGRTDQSDGAA